MGIEELQLSYIATALNATVLEHFGLKKYKFSSRKIAFLILHCILGPMTW